MFSHLAAFGLAVLCGLACVGLPHVDHGCVGTGPVLVEPVLFGPGQQTPVQFRSGYPDPILLRPEKPIPTKQFNTIPAKIITDLNKIISNTILPHQIANITDLN